MRIEYEVKLGFKDVMIRPKRSTLKSRALVDLNRTYVFRHTQKLWTGIPVIAANMDTVGTFFMAEELARYSLLTAVHKHYTPDEWDSFLENKKPGIYNHIMVSSGTRTRIFRSSGRSSAASQKSNLSASTWPTATRNISWISSRKPGRLFPRSLSPRGTWSAARWSRSSSLAGADMIKVGIGPGSVCTTRVKTGVGYPQLSAIIECADAAHGLKGLIIADGGCTCPGDVSKAFGAGADFVMLGGMFAGHDECGGEILDIGGEQCVEFYGMSSSVAMEKYSGGVAEYRASEGKAVTVPYRGGVENTIQDILGGIRSTCTYVGAAKLKELAKRTTFIRNGGSRRTKHSNKL